MKKRSALTLLALLLVAANFVFFSLRTQSDADDTSTKSRGNEPAEFVAHWVVFMPDFEKSQRSDSKNFGVHTGQPPDHAFDVVDGKPVSTLSAVAGKCRVQEYAIRNANDSEVYVSARLFAEDLTSDQKGCLKKVLPDGYRTARLISPSKPSQIASSDDLSSLTEIESQ